MLGRMTRPESETGSHSLAEHGSARLSRVWQLELPYTSPPLTFNQLNGRHWSATAKVRRGLHETAFYLSRSGRMPRPVPKPVTIELIYWPGNNTVHDSDGLFVTVKYLVDGLRRAGVLTDDRGRYVRSTICTVIERADDPEDRADARMLLVVREL